MRLLILIVVTMVCAAASAQNGQYNFSRLDIYTGLSHNQVTAILEDQDGFVWFGTLSGLNRYDGYSCKIFKRVPGDSTSLSDNYIVSIYELPEGKMWLKTRNAPCIYNPDTEKFDTGYNKYLHSLGLPQGTVSNIVKGNNGRYWFLYDNLGLYLYTDTDKKAKAMSSELQPSPSDKINSLKEGKDEKLWLVYQSGLVCAVDIRTSKIVYSSTGIRDLNNGNSYYNISPDNDGDVWVWSFQYGAFLLHPQNNRIRQFNENSSPSRLSSNLVSQIVQDNNGLIWVSTDHGGVTLIDKKNNFSTAYLLNDPKDLKSLSQNSITALYIDSDGIIWLGTYKQGVNFLNSNIVKFPYYHHDASNTRSLQYDDVNRFAEDKAGNIWIGTNGGGLIYFDRKDNTFRQYLHEPGNKNSLSTNVIVSLWMDKQDILWIGTYMGGLNSFDGKTFTQYRNQANDTTSLANDNVWEIFEDQDQNLWIGTLGGGLDLFDRQTRRFIHHQYANGVGLVHSNFITAMMQDRKGSLWIGSDNGIVVFDKRKNTTAYYKATDGKNALGNGSVICLLEDSRGRIWIGTREGLNLFDPKTQDFKVLTTADGLPDNMILNILEDSNKTLWISTPNGMCSAVPNVNGKRVALSVVNYDEKNNLQNREFNDNAAIKTRRGELFFGGPYGFNIIDPVKLSKNLHHSKIVFTNLLIFNNNVEPGRIINGRVLLERSLLQTEHVTLKYNENVFTIEFAALDFAPSNQNKYAYMLEGFNPDWLYSNGNQRQVTYTNLDPGHYTFKVKALNGDGLWSDVKTLKITVQPPFWRTPFAYAMYAVVIAGLFLLGRRITIERIRMRYEVKQQRQEVEKAHAIEQLKTKFFTNVSHEFRTPLSLIISPLDKIINQTPEGEQKKQLNLVQRNAKRLLSLVNQLLDFRKMEVQEIRLHPAIGDIIKFCRDISYSFTDIAEKKSIGFSFTSNVESLEIYFDSDKIEKILFNLLSNAFKYTHDHGTVRIHLNYTAAAIAGADGTLAIEVTDTGIGIPSDMHDKVFERFFQTDVPQSMVNQGTGIGLAITKEFVKLHGGIITVKSEPEKGTCFTVLLPAKKFYQDLARITTQPLVEESAGQMTSEMDDRSGKKKTIMIVDDNEDIRFYLKDNLKNQYHVEEAPNGEEGWERIKELNPDLVVSDVMMPLMDGIELARRIKSETLTSHIPVILLTARGSEEKQLEGLNAGVNDYITKPFTFEILASRIRNLLAQQKLLQKRFQKQIEVNPQEITITPVDERFIKQALEVVEKNIDNAGFSVEDFSRDMYMNRVTLYRKILSITGKTPIGFIRSIRLKRAAQLLEKSGMTVAEIAYEVGFNDPKHFSKFFKEEFKVLPSQYLASKSAKEA